jgi:hypothetical protein
MNKPLAKEHDFPQLKRDRVEQDRRVLERRQTQRRDPQQWEDTRPPPEIKNTSIGK